MKKEKKKPYQYTARIKPFKLEIDFKQGAVVTGFWEPEKDTVARYTKHVPVTKGDVWYHDRKRGLILNGKAIPVRVLPPKKYDTKMGWAAEKLRVAVFKDQDAIWNRRTKKPTGRFGKPYWVAMDTRSYWIGTGDTVQTALAGLIRSIKVTDEFAKEDQKKGKKVIRWHVERTPGTRKELDLCEKKARKTGFILDGVEWRKAEFAKKMAGN